MGRGRKHKIRMMEIVLIEERITNHGQVRWSCGHGERWTRLSK